VPRKNLRNPRAFAVRGSVMLRFVTWGNAPHGRRHVIQDGTVDLPESLELLLHPIPGSAANNVFPTAAWSPAGFSFFTATCPAARNRG
jgi:hypothetical protein